MFNEILVPLDGSELSERALPIAQDLAQSSEATVHLIHMVSRENEYTAGPGADSVMVAELQIEAIRRLNEGRLDRGRKYLDQVVSRLSGAGVKVESQYAVREGDASENIIDYVKEHGISLVVMTTHGHGGIRRLFLGSVTDRVIRSCEVPVLAVPCS